MEELQLPPVCPPRSGYYMSKLHSSANNGSIGLPISRGAAEVSFLFKLLTFVFFGKQEDDKGAKGGIWNINIRTESTASSFIPVDRMKFRSSGLTGWMCLPQPRIKISGEEWRTKWCQPKQIFCL
jgi:hypothetical protein